MQKFQDNRENIVIEDASGNRFNCPSAWFVSHEETYQPLQAGYVRVWMPLVQYLSDGSTQQADPFYTPGLLASYVAKMSTYQAIVDGEMAAPAPTFEQAQTGALTACNRQVGAFINQYFDTGTQISFVKLYIQSEAARPLISQVDAWVMAVMGYYYQIKAQIQAAGTLEELNQLQASLEFESRFGQQGSVLAVPDVKLSSFFGGA